MSYKMLGEATNDGKIMVNSEAYKYAAARFHGRTLTISIEEYREPKSKEQLGYFFAGVIPDAARFFEMEEGDLLDIILKRCSTKAVTLPSGEIETVIQRISEMDMPEYSRFIDKAILELETWGHKVEAPEEYKARMAKQAKRLDREL